MLHQIIFKVLTVFLNSVPTHGITTGSRQYAGFCTALVISQWLVSKDRKPGFRTLPQHAPAGQLWANYLVSLKLVPYLLNINEISSYLV